MNEHILTGLVTLFALGSAAQLLAWHLKIPSILVLLATGLLAGPGLNLLAPSNLLGEVTFPLVSLGAAIILFEGGLTARWQDLRDVRGAVGRLVSVGLLITWVLATAGAYYLLGLTFELACLLGAILVVTGPTVIGPILRHARPDGRVGHILKYEGIVNDPIGAIVALIVFQVIQLEQVEAAASLVAWSVFRALSVSAALGLLAGWIYVEGRRRSLVPDALSNAVLLPLVLAAYALSNHMQPESGLLTVTVMGIALASQEKIDIDPNVEFAEHLRTMLISVLFVLLTARLKWEDLARLPAAGFLFVGFMVLLVRPLSVFGASLGSDLQFKERALLAGVAPRGIVAAAVASVFSLRLTESGAVGAELLMPITFLVIACCVIIYGLGTRPLVKLLGLNQIRPRGVLFLGAGRVARALGDALGKAGVPIMLVDRDRANVLKARALGLPATHGHLLSDHVINRLDLNEYGQLIALSPSDDTNTLVVQHIRAIMGEDHVAQVTCNADRVGEASTIVSDGQFRGAPFSPTTDYDGLTNWASRGRVKITAITAEFSWEDFLDHRGDSVLPVLVLGPEGAPRVYAESDRAEPGEQIVSFVLDAVYQGG